MGFWFRSIFCSIEQADFCSYFWIVFTSQEWIWNFSNTSPVFIGIGMGFFSFDLLLWQIILNCEYLKLSSQYLVWEGFPLQPLVSFPSHFQPAFFEAQEADYPELCSCGFIIFCSFNSWGFQMPLNEALRLSHMGGFSIHVWLLLLEQLIFCGPSQPFALPYSARKRWRVKSRFLNSCCWQPRAARLPPHFLGGSHSVAVFTHMPDKLHYHQAVIGTQPPNTARGRAGTHWFIELRPGDVGLARLVWHASSAVSPSAKSAQVLVFH